MGGSLRTLSSNGDPPLTREKAPLPPPTDGRGSTKLPARASFEHQADEDILCRLRLT